MKDNDKIEVLNQSVSEMIDELVAIDAGHGLIRLTLIAFRGQRPAVIYRNVPVGSISFKPLNAGGKTPMGMAFSMTSEIIENKEEISSKSYRPTIALVSDGLPVPPLAGELELLLNGARGAKSSRFALAVGADADREMLARFSSTGEVHEASEATEIRNFLQWVTTTVTEETRTVFHGVNDPQVESQDEMDESDEDVDS